MVYLFNSNALDGGDIYESWMMQETPRKYTNPTHNDIRVHSRLNGNMM
jgi:hypothetical protein